MQTARFGGFEPTRFSSVREAVETQSPAISDDVRLSRQERDAAILSGKLPDSEQEHDRGDAVSLAGWLALMSL